MGRLEGFFQSLWGDSVGFAELRLIAPGQPVQQKFFSYPAELNNLISEAQNASGQFNVYFGVNLRSKKSGKAEDVDSVCTLWADLDFKKSSQDEVERKLKTFPLRPSLGVASGAGYHIYWLLKEPATGEDLKKIPLINQSIAKILGGDSVGDLPRILRSPETLNVKYEPARPCAIVANRPELRYSLGDFDIFPVSQPVPVEPRETMTSRESPLGGAVTGELLPLAPELKNKLVPLLASMWHEGTRHQAALFLAGMMAKCEIDIESTLDLVRRVCTSMDDAEVDDRLRAVEESYAKARKNPEAVGGAMRLERDVVDELPATIRAQARAAFGIVRRTVQAIKKEAESASTDLSVIKATRYGLTPATWDIEISYKGANHTIHCGTQDHLDLKKFDVLCRDEYGIILPLLTKARWRNLLVKAPIEVKKVESSDATTTGYLTQIIHDFEDQARPEKSATLALKSVPVKLDSGEIVLRLPALLGHLRREGIEGRNRSEVITLLHRMGYQDKLVRIGTGPTRVWIRGGATETPPQASSPEGNGKAHV
jgi:hypothetical protein